MRELVCAEYPNEVFTVDEVSDGEWQAVYPEALAEEYGAVYSHEEYAWEAIYEDAEQLGLTLVEKE